MKLPNAEIAAPPPKEKITGYLLNSDHLAGRGKARFFSRFGFSLKAWRVLAAALNKHAIGNDISGVEVTDYGKKYIIEGKLDTPSGRSPTIRAVWFISRGETVPRFVTAYPVEGKDNDERA